MTVPETANASANHDDFRRAVAHVRAHYPTDVFPEDGTSIDCATARFARGLCDEIVRLADEYAADRQD
ncbi:MAG TPA: hypothetical protein VHD87_15405 [Acidimicrobiales bacterium]|nr:hypothetical protein [Acidimicrobiales bacterium]